MVCPNENEGMVIVKLQNIRTRVNVKMTIIPIFIDTDAMIPAHLKEVDGFSFDSWVAYGSNGPLHYFVSCEPLIFQRFKRGRRHMGRFF